MTWENRSVSMEFVFLAYPSHPELRVLSFLGISLVYTFVITGNGLIAGVPPSPKDSTRLSNPACDTARGAQERPGHCQGDGETTSSPCTGAHPSPLPSNPLRQEPGLRQVQPASWEAARDGAAQEVPDPGWA